MKSMDWLSERVIFGGIILAGYFTTGAIIMLAPIGDASRSSGRDVLLTVGPMIGIIVQSIWKTDKTDRVAANTAAVLAAKAPDMSVPTPPAPPVPTQPAPIEMDDIVDSTGAVFMKGHTQ